MTEASSEDRERGTEGRERGTEDRESGTRPTDCHDQRHKLTEAGVDPERHTHTQRYTYTCMHKPTCMHISFSFLRLFLFARREERRFYKSGVKKSLSSLRAVRHATGLMIPHKPPLANK